MNFPFKGKLVFFCRMFAMFVVIFRKIDATKGYLVKKEVGFEYKNLPQSLLSNEEKEKHVTFSKVGPSGPAEIQCIIKRSGKLNKKLFMISVIFRKSIAK